MKELELPLIRVEAVLESDDPLKLPRYLFSSIRGVLGSSLKRISCVARRYSKCLECPLNQHCAYGYIFETPRPENAERLRLYPYLPHPFAITPPYPTPTSPSFTLGLTLVGRAIQYFPHFILCLEAAGKRGLGYRRVPFKIRDIKDANGKSLYTPSADKLHPPNLISTFYPENCRSLEIFITTPLSLKYQDKTVTPQVFTFHILVRNLLRRISALSYFHCGQELDIDFKGLIEAAHEVETVRKDLAFVKTMRYSARTRMEMPLQGLIGKIAFQGELTPFTPFLKAGSLVHVGKSTSFGLGHFTIKMDKN